MNSNQISITMSSKDWVTLTSYLLMNTKAREEEAKACARLSKETDEDGNLIFSDMNEYSKFIDTQNIKINEICQTIDDACSTPQINHSRLTSLVSSLIDGLIQDDEEQAYIYLKETCNLDSYEIISLGLDPQKWAEYNAENIFENI